LEAVATRSGSQLQPGVGEYDIHVLAFPAATPRTVQGLCELFGLDANGAQRIIRSAPSVLRQRVPVAEAEACAQALRKLGARVVLEPAQPRDPPPPPAAAFLQHTAHWGPGARGANDDLPLPAPRTAAPDLEYDVLSALDAALDGSEVQPAARHNPAHDALEESSLEEPLLSDDASSLAVKGRQDELDLGGGASRASMELELDAPPAQAKHKAADSAPRKALPLQQNERQAPPGATQPRQPVAPVGASRAALIEHRRAAEAPRSRSVPLLQLLAACGVFAAGYWVDSSILYGNASPVSVVAHGLALQQLLLGLRGLFQ